MQQRQFQFERPGGEPLAVSVLCREPPEAQAGKTLTWQLDGHSESRRAQAKADGGSSSSRDSTGGVAPAAAAAPAADQAPDLIGLDIWPAAIALCRYLAMNPQLVAGTDVLELGAGDGLPGGLGPGVWERHTLHLGRCGLVGGLACSWCTIST